MKQTLGSTAFLRSVGALVLCRDLCKEIVPPFPGLKTVENLQIVIDIVNNHLPGSRFNRKCIDKHFQFSAL